MKKSLGKWCRPTCRQSKKRSDNLSPGSGSGSTVGSEVRTAVGEGPSGAFARPPPGVAVRLNDLFCAKKDGIQGLGHRLQTDTEVSNFINGLHHMVPEALKKYVDWEQTRTEQGTWPTPIMVSVCGSATRPTC